MKFMVLEPCHLKSEDGKPVHFSKQYLINAVRTLSKGYKCNDRRRYKVAVLQLITMSSEALRFEEMKEHVATGFDYEYYEKRPLTPRLKVLRGNWGKMSQSVWEDESSFTYTCSGDKEVTIERDKMHSVLSLLNTKKRDPDLLLQLLTSPDGHKSFGASSKRGNLSSSSPSKQAQLHSDPSRCLRNDTIGMSTASRMTSYVKQNVRGFGSSSKMGYLSSSSPSKPALCVFI